MGIYTDSHDGKRYSINIAYPELQMINNNPDFHFCWMSENEPIRDENSDYYEDESKSNTSSIGGSHLLSKTNNANSINSDSSSYYRRMQQNNNEDKKENNEDKKENNNTRRVLKEKITVMTAAGKTITGRVWHWVCGPCASTKLRDWFLICTKPYPYISCRKQAWN